MSHPAAAAASVSRNAFLNLVGQVTTGVVALACIPLTVAILGVERFGLLSLLLVLVGYFSLLDLGLGPAVTRTVAEALGSGAPERVPVVFRTANRLQLIVGAAGAVILVASVPLLVDRALSVPPDLQREARLSFYLCAIALPGVLVSSSLVGLLQAARRFDLTNAVQVPLGIAQFLLPVLCGLWWPNLAFVVGVLLLSRLTGVGLLLLLAKRVFPGFWTSGRYDTAESRALFRFGGWVTISSVVSPIMVYADRFLLGSLRSMAAVSYYSVPSDAASRLLIIPRSLVPALFPVFSSVTDAGARSRLAARALKFILVFVGVPAVPLLVLAPRLMSFWMGEDFASRSSLPLQILLAGVVFNALAYVPSSLTQAVGRADVTAGVHLAEFPAYVAVAYVCIRNWGPEGAALAWSLRTIVDLLALLWMARRVAGMAIGDLVRERLVLMALTLAGCTIVGLAAPVFLEGAVWKFATAAVVGTVAAVVSWRHCLTADDRQRLLGVAGRPFKGEAAVALAGRGD